MANVLLPSQDAQSLWRGALLATIAHAFGVRRYPDVSNLQSWDVYAYSVQNNMGDLGTVCFPRGPDEVPACCAGSFFEPRSDRAKTSRTRSEEAFSFFAEAGPTVVPLAQQSLNYLLDDDGGS